MTDEIKKIQEATKKAKEEIMQKAIEVHYNAQQRGK
jgi:hypothetical protein